MRCDRGRSAMVVHPVAGIVVIALHGVRVDRQRRAGTPVPPMPLTWRYSASGNSRRVGERKRFAVDDRDVERERVEAFHATEVDTVTVLTVLASNGTVRKDAAGLAEIVAHDSI